MRVLFAVSNDKMTEAIVKQYEKQYKEIISYKNVYYFNAILKELQRDKTYDRIVISEDLEQYTSSDFEQMDNFIFGRLDSISDEAANLKGEDIPIILICEERRRKGEELLIKLFGIGVYNAIIGSDRSINEVCRLINRPRLKKEAKVYYKIDSEDVLYEKNDENEVSELEIQNILAHYKKIGNDEQKILDSFDSIAAQYNTIQLKIICKFLPLNVRAILEERSSKYAEIFAYEGVNNDVRMTQQEQKQLRKLKGKAVRANQEKEKTSGTSEILLETSENNLKEPVIIPSAMSTNVKKVIKTAEKEKKSLELDNELIYNTGVESELNNNEDEESNVLPEIDVTQEEIVEQPEKRRRGRPKKIVTEPVEVVPKRKRGRPRKNETVEDLKKIDNNEIEKTLPGFEDSQEETILPGFEEDEKDEVLPGFERNEILPGFVEEKQSNLSEKEDDSILPGFEDSQDINVLPSFEETGANTFSNANEEKINKNVFPQSNNEKVFSNQDNLNTNNYNKVSPKYEELDIDRLLTSNQKIVSFVGTSKNGTSFLVNNVAEILAMNNVNTAIVDLTQNRNAYYIYTKNEESLRVKANECIRGLKDGMADGIEVHKNLTVYTSAFDVGEIENVEPIIQTLLKKHSIILLDCDFNTPYMYFKYSQEIYLVQSMDILTIQPLTLFLNKLNDKGAFDERKVRVILNKFVKTKELNQEILVGGISRYNDAGMTISKELFNRRTVKTITIPLEIETYLRYLDGLVICDISLKGYSKKLLQSLKQLATLVYSGNNSSNNKYTPPSAKNTTFSSSMNSTLEQMSKRY